MRSNFLHLIILPFIFLIVFVSCNNDKPDLVGNWSPVSVDFKYVDTNHLSVGRLNELSRYEKTEFTKDGKFIASSKDDTAYGTYIYNKTQKKLAISIKDENKSTIFTVQFSGNDQVALTRENGTITFKRY